MSKFVRPGLGVPTKMKVVEEGRPTKTIVPLKRE